MHIEIEYKQPNIYLQTFLMAHKFVRRLKTPKGLTPYEYVGNVIGQSKATSEPVLLAYGTEVNAWISSSLVLSHNTSEGSEITFKVIAN